MKIIQYQNDSRRFARYPADKWLVYPVLGLMGEAGEFFEKFQKRVLETELISEAGDVLWYLANIATDSSMLLHEILLTNSFSDLEQSILPSTNLIQMGIQIGKLSELVKKMIRDDNGRLTPERKERIKNSLVHIINEWGSICASRNLNLTTIAEYNLQKLSSRLERNKLHGDGDNR